MSFCPSCDHRPAHCLRRCPRHALGEHLWRVIQAELLRDRPANDNAHLSFDRQAEDVQRAFIVGAEKIRQMPG